VVNVSAQLLQENSEVRLGLVMYGGVSLAVYINGVAREFFEAVRGSGIYGLIRQLTNSKITVDIISGTSAGGINGIFLGYALANNKNFGEMANLWRELGDISSLLQNPKSGPQNTHSLLDSKRFYHNALLKAFREMGDLPNEDLQTSELDLFVTGTNIDGNIYTTFDDQGHAIDVKDHRSVFVLKHRKGRKEPFKADSRAYYTRPDVAYEALSTLSRITSCFPAAFEPVEVEFREPPDNAPYTDSHQCLQHWGAIGKKAYFLDGGILDNKPFSYTMDAIFGRTANSDVERFLCYVEPDPESFERGGEPQEPSFLQATVKGGLTITSYESIADDLNSLRVHNSRVHRYARLCENLRGKCGTKDGVVPKDDGSPSMLLYSRARFNAIADRAVEGLLKENGRASYLGDTETKKRDQAAALITAFHDWRGDGVSTLQHFDVYFRLRRLFHLAYKIKEDLYDRTNGQAPPDLNKRRLWEALNRQIKVFETIRYWMEYTIDYLPIRWLDEQSALRPPVEIWRDITNAMCAMLAVKGVLDELGPNYQTDHVVSTTPDTLFDQADITKLHRFLSRRWKALRDGQVPAPATPDSQYVSILTWVDALTEKTFRAYADVDRLRTEYDQFLSLDSVIYPLEDMADLHQKDIIRIVRFSPADAQRGFSKGDLKSKLSGDAFGHFAGFFKRSWRSNDILWGRLDATSQLVEMLFSEDRIRSMVEKQYLRQDIRAGMGFGDPGPRGLRSQLRSAFPNAGDGSINRLADWLESLFTDDDAERARVWSQPHFKKDYAGHLDLFVSMAQLEILKSDLDSVMADAIFEQSRWNTFRIARPAARKAAARLIQHFNRAQTLGRPKPSAVEVAEKLALLLGPDRDIVYEQYCLWDGSVNQLPQERMEAVMEGVRKSLPQYDAVRSGFVHGDARTDPLVMTVASRHYARYGLAFLTETDKSSAPEPLQTKLGAFFRCDYRVGTETILNHIPKIILVELFCRAMLVLKNCFLGSLNGEARERIENNFILRFVFDIPPRILIAISKSLREDSAVTVALKTAVTVLAAAAFVVGVIFWDPLIYSAGTFAMRWFIGLLVLPPIALCLMWLTRFERIFGGVAAVLGSIVGVLGIAGQFKAADPQGYHLESGSLALQFAGTAARAKELIGQIHSSVIQEQLTLDSKLVIPLYVLLFIGFGTWLCMRLSRQWRSIGVFAWILALAGATADFLENRRIGVLLASGADVADSAAQAVQNVSRLKWAALLLVIGCVAVGCLRLSYGRDRAERLSARFFAGLTALVGIATVVIGGWSVIEVSHHVEWSLIGIALTTALAGVSIVRMRTAEE